MPLTKAWPKAETSWIPSKQYRKNTCPPSHIGVLALHIIGVICWFAGLFYLPRLFVYHAMTQEYAVNEQFKIMEHKLFFYIMWPSMLITLLSGFALMMLLPDPAHWHWINWLSVKLCFVGLLVIFHYGCHYYLALFRLSLIHI